MALTRVEFVNGMNALTAQLSKVDVEVKGLKTKISSLEAALNADEVSPEVEAAFAAVKAQVQVVDENVPDTADLPDVGDALPAPDGVEGEKVTTDKSNKGGVAPQKFDKLTETSTHKVK